MEDKIYTETDGFVAASADMENVSTQETQDFWELMNDFLDGTPQDISYNMRRETKNGVTRVYLELNLVMA